MPPARPADPPPARPPCRAPSWSRSPPAPASPTTASWRPGAKVSDARPVPPPALAPRRPRRGPLGPVRPLRSPSVSALLAPQKGPGGGGGLAARRPFQRAGVPPAFPPLLPPPLAAPGVFCPGALPAALSGLGGFPGVVPGETPLLGTGAPPRREFLRGEATTGGSF